MPERMVAELAEVACGVPYGSLGWWWGAMRFSWVVVGWCGHTVLLVGGGSCHTVLLGGCAIKINNKKNGYGSCGA